MKQPSTLLFQLLEHFEGFKTNAYTDVAGIATIGYGTTHYPNGNAVQMGDTCTEEEAQTYLCHHLTGLVAHLNATVPDSVTQAQFDSLVDFGYNAGQGAWDSSSLRTVVNNDPDAHLNATVPDSITQAQFDSLVDFGYNAGQGAWDSSSLRTVVNNDPNNFDLITEDFCKWDKAHINGQLMEVDGLLRRRKCEAYLYANGFNHETFFWNG